MYIMVNDNQNSPLKIGGHREVGSGSFYLYEMDD